MRLSGLIASLFIFSSAYSQNIFTALVKDQETTEVLVGATAKVKNSSLGASTNVAGLVQIQNVPDGPQVIEFSFVGYESQSITLNFPLSSSEPVEILLKASEEELEEIVVPQREAAEPLLTSQAGLNLLQEKNLKKKAI